MTRTPHKLAAKTPEERAKYAREVRLGALDTHADLVESMAFAAIATDTNERYAWLDRIERLLTATSADAPAEAATIAGVGR